MGFRIGYLLLLAALTTMFAACGGGGGTAPVITPITVTAAKNPVLQNLSTTVSASFGRFSTAVKGNTVNFSISAGAATLGTSTDTVGAGGTASVKVKGNNQPGTYTVSASSGNFAGSTSLKFIPQPDAANVHLIINPPVIAPKNLVAFQFDIQRTGSGVFDKAFPENDLVGNIYGGLLNPDGSLVGANENSGTGITTIASITSSLTAGITTRANVSILRFQYKNIVSGLPTYTAIPNDLSNPPKGIIALDGNGNSLGLTTDNIILTVDYLKNGQVL